MSLNELGSSHPVEEVPTPSETENVMVDQEEQASATSENADESTQEPVDSKEEEQSRINARFAELTRKQREAEERAIKAEARAEALGERQEASKERTLEDLNITELQSFITKAQTEDSGLEEHLPQARELLMDKKIEERLNGYKQEQTEKSTQQESEQLTNTMLSNLSDGKLKDESSPYFGAAQNYLYDLQNDFSTINQSQLLAVALAEIDYLKTQKTGPSMEERVVQNRNNKVIANSRSAAGGSSDLASFLSENGKLTTSRQGSKGTLRNAIEHLGAVKSLE